VEFGPFLILLAEIEDPTGRLPTSVQKHTGRPGDIAGQPLVAGFRRTRACASTHRSSARRRAAGQSPRGSATMAVLQWFPTFPNHNIEFCMLRLGISGGPCDAAIVAVLRLAYIGQPAQSRAACS
jgi:hypothetical protein